jgi:hypothetical protein
LTVAYRLDGSMAATSGEVGGGACEKLAETLSSALIVTVQVPMPPHAPPQPAKLKPLAGVSVRLTCVPIAKLAEQEPPLSMQLINGGELVTAPEPVSLTDRV